MDVVDKEACRRVSARIFAAKNLFTIAHSRLDVMPASPSRLPSNGVAGLHFAGVTGRPR